MDHAVVPMALHAMSSSAIAAIRMGSAARGIPTVEQAGKFVHINKRIAARDFFVFDKYLHSSSQPAFGSCSGVTKTTTKPATSSSTTSKPTSTPSSTTTSTTSTAAPGGGPSFVPNYGAFKLKGCYSEPAGARALPNLYADDNMTVEKCLDAAAKFAYAGIEFGRECWYGNTLNSGSTEQPLTAAHCGVVCPGNTNEYCGGSSRLVLYAGPSPSLPSQPATVGNARWYNCMTEATNVRALSDKSFASDTMTLETCGSFCSPYTFFGVEFGRECYCGNVLNAGSVQAPATDCNMVCAGNSLNLCGAGNRLSVYTR